MIVIAAMPKSASQYFIAAFEQTFADDYQIARGKLTLGNGHNFLCEKQLATELNPGKSAALYGHIPFTTYNEQVVARFSKLRRAIITVRNLPDAVVSYKDHIDKYGFGPLDPRTGDCAEGASNWSDFSDRRKFEYLITFVVPWYVRFVGSWLIAAEQGWDIMFSTFEQHTAKTDQTMREVASRFRLSVTRSEPETRNEEHRRVNFNRGVCGRGKQIDADLRTQIENQLRLAISSENHESLIRYLLHGQSASDSLANADDRTVPDATAKKRAA